MATVHNTVYAFDADDPRQTAPYWSVNLGPAIPFPPDVYGGYVQPEMGIMGTPAIDLGTRTLYVVAATQQGLNPALYLSALDMATGGHKFGSPALIQAQVSGSVTGYGVQRVERAKPDCGLQYDFERTAGRSVAIRSGFPADSQGNEYVMTGNGTYNGTAGRAVDGNTDGNFNDGSVAHTDYDPSALWQVDLGASKTVNSVVVWNRTDCCGDRLSDYWIFVSNTPFGPTDTPATLQNRAGTWSSHQTAAPNPSSSVAVPGAQGQYVRVQLAGANFLNVTEVQVIGF